MRLGRLEMRVAMTLALEAMMAVVATVSGLDGLGSGMIPVLAMLADTARRKKVTSSNISLVPARNQGPSGIISQLQ